jgi:hypothetical protein
MSALTQPQREELRYALREQLVQASTVALTAAMLNRRIERVRLLDFKFTEADVSAAATFLVSLGHAREIPAALGATLYYQATAAGVLAHERGT